MESTPTAEAMKLVYKIRPYGHTREFEKSDLDCALMIDAFVSRHVAEKDAAISELRRDRDEAVNANWRFREELAALRAQETTTAEQREPGWYIVKMIEPGPPGGGFHLGDGWYLAHWGDYWDHGPWSGVSAPFAEIRDRILPPSTAPSQPQQQCTHHRMMQHCYECEQEAAALSDPPDMDVETVLHAEPGQPSNPAVEMVERVALSTCELAEDIGICPCMRLGGMNPSCLKRGRNGIAAVRKPTDAMLAAGGDLLLDGTIEIEDAEKNAGGVLRAMIDAALSPPTGPTNEGHGR